MKTTEDQLDIIKASIVFGKVIEHKRCEDDYWTKKTDITYWDWSTFHYRIAEKPEYVPFSQEDTE